MKIKKHLNFTTLRKYVSKIFSCTNDKRQQGKVDITTHDAMMSGFACMYFQDPSMLQFQLRLENAQQQNNLRTMFGVEVIPKSTEMAKIIDNVSSDHFQPVFKELYSRLQRGKHLEQFHFIDGQYYVPIDGTEIYSSKKICCKQCLRKQSKNTKGKKGEVTYSHQVLQAAIAHPNMSTIIPFMPEQIRNEDGQEKQDCETNAAKRMIGKLREQHPQLGFTIGGDALFATQPFVEALRNQRMNYIIMVKPTKHTYLFDWIDAYKELNSFEFTDEKNHKHIYQWMNNVPLNGRKDPVKVNFLKCMVIGHKEYKLSLLPKRPLNIAKRGCIWIYKTDAGYQADVTNYLGESHEIDILKIPGINAATLESLPWNAKRKVSNLQGEDITTIIELVLSGCEHTLDDQAKKETILYTGSWVTDHVINEENVGTLISGGRCRWKNENEMFNVMKNQGYCMEHNYGHGKENLCFNNYLLTLLAFSFHQIFELTDNLYQSNRKKFGSKRHMWETLRSYIKIIVFDSWEALLEFALKPTSFELSPLGNSS